MPEQPLETWTRNLDLDERAALGTDLEGAHPAPTRGSPLCVIHKMAPLPVRTDVLFCWRQQVQYFLNPRQTLPEKLRLCRCHVIMGWTISTISPEYQRFLNVFSVAHWLFIAIRKGFDYQEVISTATNEARLNICCNALYHYHLGFVIIMTFSKGSYFWHDIMTAIWVWGSIGLFLIYMVRMESTNPTDHT